MASTGRGCRLVAVIMLAATWIVPVGGRETSVVQPGGRPATSGVIRNAQAAFSVSVVPAVSVPVRIGARFGFHLSSGTAGYASLYMIDPVYSVQVLAENLPLPAGSLEYPSSSQGFTLRADSPVGLNWVILLVTRQPASHTATVQRFLRQRHPDDPGEHGARRSQIRVVSERRYQWLAAIILGCGRGTNSDSWMTGNRTRAREQPITSIRRVET